MQRTTTLVRLLGSPPLTRGKAKGFPAYSGFFRITPAYAGKSQNSEAYFSQKKDHPRLRGEKPVVHTGSDKRQGSPPLTRGKVIYPACIVDSARITPAYAGKRISYSLPPTSRRDHPRLRGEKRCNINLIFVPRGSPPLTRGKGSKVVKCSVKLGITPAYAGKSSVHMLHIAKKKDHPRLRGEKRKPP